MPRSKKKLARVGGTTKGAARKPKARAASPKPTDPRKPRWAAATRVAAKRLPRAGGPAASVGPESYEHADKAIQRPAVGVEAQFRSTKAPRNYRYDSSLDPALSWDENAARDLGEWLLGLIEHAQRETPAAVFPAEWQGGGVRVENVEACVRLLKQLSQPFLNWSGKAERHQISVPTLPLFVHERHSTKAILETVRHRRPRGQSLDLFGDPGMDIGDNLSAYEHEGPWANRMILGDGLLVMNSLLEYEGLGGQVQMIYIDPPYGVKFGSNFQPFVRKRDVKHGGDEDMTREPEMVKAYRDTWELGLHSYLTYLRDRLLLARELLHESGSVFVQISDENLHHVREVLDEVFGDLNRCAVISFKKTSGAGSPSLGTDVLASVSDFLLWYAKDKPRVKFRQLYNPKANAEGEGAYTWLALSNGNRRRMSPEERDNASLVPEGARVFRADNLTSQSGVEKTKYPIELDGRVFRPAKGVWKTSEEGMKRLVTQRRVILIGNTPSYVRYFSDFPVQSISNFWEDTVIAGFAEPKIYAVQTSAKVVQRCILMCSDPGDLVLDPTCGSGTTAYVAEQWGRRWITIDTSRVPLALTRQRLLTATFPYYELKDSKVGPRSGFVYKHKQNQKGEEVGGLVPHITLKSIANNEEPTMEVLVDRPEKVNAITRVAGPFVVEATIPAASEVFDKEAEPLVSERSPSGAKELRAPYQSTDTAAHIDRMLELLRKSRTLRLSENRTLVLDGIRRVPDAQSLHAEATEKNGKDRRIAILFGPENGAVTSEHVFEAASEAYFLKYDHLYVFGFAIQAKARELMEERAKLRIPCTYISVTPDVVMGDLLKTTRASEIFSVTGLPDVEARPAKAKGPNGETLYEVEVEGLDIFDPSTLETDSVDAQNLPCWMLDSDYNGMAFYASQVFFPKTAAWDNLKRSLGAAYDDSVWDHFAGTVSEPFAAGDKRRVAVKVIDERGNELMVVKDLP